MGVREGRMTLLGCRVLERVLARCKKWMHDSRRTTSRKEEEEGEQVGARCSRR